MEGYIMDYRARVIHGYTHNLEFFPAARFQYKFVGLVKL